MSADLLRRAAAKLREHAQALPGTMTGTWFTRSSSYVIADDGTDIGMLVVDAYQPKDDRALMAYIALMHPPVALALADWLADIANGPDLHQLYDPKLMSSFVNGWDQAVTVARAILREKS